MDEIRPGMRIKITSKGITIIGTVDSCHNDWNLYTTPKTIIGYNIELTSDTGKAYYWKSDDGGSIEILPAE